MSTNKILLKFAKKGINLSPEAYNRVINAENPIDFASSLIVKLKSDKFSSKDLISVSGETVDELTGIKPVQENNSQETKEINSDTDYNNEELKRRISNLKHKSENCIKIFEIDRVRAKQEIININKSLDNILNNLLNVSRETFN